VPNRRRRKLSTAMSAVAALAVASPFAVTAAAEMTASGPPAPQQHDFVQAAMMTDLPGDVMSALQSSLSQFGIVVPNVPSGILGPSSVGSNPPFPQGAPMPGLTAPTPGLTTQAPGLTPPAPGALNNPALTNPALTNPALTNPALTNPALTNPAVTNPAVMPATSPAPGLPPGTPTGPTVPGLTTPPTGLTTPAAGLNPALTSPLGATPGQGAPSGLGATPGVGGLPGDDSLANTYPILGDPIGAAAPAPSGGLISDLSSAANQLGASQAIDLLKGVVVPSIMQAIKSAGTAAPAVAPPPIH
jgi:hypothetical protein